MKRNLEEGFPINVANLCAHLHDMLDSMLPDQIMHFRSGLRGTCLFWKKRRGELTNMIIQMGSPTFLFTISVDDTKWDDMHMVMLGSSAPPPGFIWDVSIQEKINNPHLVAQYICCQFTIFLEEVLEKGLHAKDLWCRFFLDHPSPFYFFA